MNSRMVAPSIDLTDFPWELLGFTSVSDFGRAYKSHIMSNILLIFPHQYHKEQINNFIKLIGLNLVTLIRDSMSTLKMVSMCSKYHWLYRGGSEMTTYNDINSSIASLDGIDMKSLRSASRLSVSDVVHEIFLEFLSFTVNDTFQSYPENPSINGNIMIILTDLSDELQFSSVDKMLYMCNLVDIVAMIYRKSINVQEFVTSVRIISSLSVIVDVMKNGSILSDTLLFGVMSAVFRSICKFSLMSGHVVPILKKIIQILNFNAMADILYELMYCEMMLYYSFLVCKSSGENNLPHVKVRKYAEETFSNRQDVPEDLAATVDAILSCLQALVGSNPHKLSMFETPEIYHKLLPVDISGSIPCNEQNIAARMRRIKELPQRMAFDYRSMKVLLWFEVRTLRHCPCHVVSFVSLVCES